jgi:hypothetical protein
MATGVTNAVMSDFQDNRVLEVAYPFSWTSTKCLGMAAQRARGWFASTVGLNEATIRQSVRHLGEQETGHA